jgi:hypothetical protein
MNVRPIVFAALFVPELLIGCSQPSSTSTTIPPPTPQISGRVYGGTSPVSGATIQLYTVGTAGDGTSATPLLTKAVTTNADGTFSIAGLYSCTNASEVYLVATGGQAVSGAANADSALITAVGPCSSVTSSTYIYVNELTTVAAVNALSTFMKSDTQIGSGTSDVDAMEAAFTLAAEYVNPATGASPGSSVPAGYTVPTPEIDTLGDLTAACIASTGGSAGDGSACGSFFTLTTTPGAAPPANTVSALLNLANNPTLNTDALYTAMAPGAPFQPVLTGIPPSFQVRLIPPTSSSYILQISPSTLTFSGTVGFASASQTITIVNSGSGPVTLSSISLIGANAADFAQTNTCGATLLPAAECTASVAFAPTATGSRNAYIEVDSSTANSPQYVQLTGTGTAPSAGPVTVSTSNLSFTIGGTTQDITLSNQGTGPLAIKSVTETDANTGTQKAGLFSIVGNNCGTSLPAQSICTISVESDGLVEWGGTPYEPYTYSGTLTIDDDATSGEQTVVLASNNSSGVIDPSDAAFTPTHVGSNASVSLQGTTGTAYSTATFGTVLRGADPDDFSVPAGCSVQVNQGDCTFSVIFQPTVSGKRTAEYFPDGGATNQYVLLSGTGVDTGPFFALNKKSVTLGDSFPNSPDPNAFTTATLILTNYGTTTFNFSGLFTGANASYGTVDGTACMSLAPNASCNVIVGFNPPAVGTYSTTLVVRDTNSTTTVSTPLTVTSSYWAVSASPSSLQFAAQAAGTTSASKSFNIQDYNGYPLDHPVSIALQPSSNFVLTNGSSCVASTSACTLEVAFSPHTTGVINETATVTDQTSGLANTLFLSGTGAAPALSLSTSSISFLPVVVGATSTPTAITITNSGTATLTISGVSLVGAASGNFAETNNCGSVPVSGTCAISVTFVPTAVGAQAAVIQILSNAASSPDTVAVSGTADAAPTAGPVTVSTSTLNFTIGGTTQDITISNEGGLPVTFTSIAETDANTGTLNPAFFVVGNNTCGSSLPAQSTCVISIQSTGNVEWGGPYYQPYTYAGTLTLQDNAVSGTQTVALASNNPIGVQLTSNVAFSPSQIGTSITETLQGTSGSAYNTATFGTVVGGADPNDFSIPSGCSIGTEQGVCTFNVVFDPTASGIRTAKYLPDGGATGQYVPLTGTGVGTGPFFSTNLKSITLNDSFPNTPDTNAFTTANLVITNYGTTTFSFAGSFSAPNGTYATINGSACMSLQPNTSCTVVVGFNPPSVGSYSTTLVIKDTNSSITVSIPITVTSNYWAVSESPRSLTFAAQAVGIESVPQTFKVQDYNGFPMNHPTSVSLQASSNFALTSGSTCPASTTQACIVGIAFNPHTTGVINEVATVTDLTSGLTSTVSLSGSAGAPVASVSTTEITFAAIDPGTSSIPTPVVITNTGTLPLTINGITITGALSGNFTETNNCTTVAINSTCTIEVTFSPTLLGAQSASVQIVSNAATSPNSVSLSGSTLGSVSAVTVSPTSMGWNVAGTLQDVTLSNPGTTPVTITSIQTGTTNFSVAGNSCGSIIPAQSLCIVTIQSDGLGIENGDPNTAATYNDTLTIVDTAANSPQTVPLVSTNYSGVGVVQLGVQPVFGSVAVGNSQAIALTESVPSYYVYVSDGVTFTLGGADPQDFYFSDATHPEDGVISECPNQGFCDFNINFVPTASGVRTAKITVTALANPYPGTSYLNVSGTATPAGPSFVLGTASFGSAFLAANNVAGTTGSVVVTNNGTTTLNPTSVSISGAAAANFTAAASAGCSGLVKLTTCTVNLSFHATALGSYGATLTVTDTASGISQTVPLSVTVGYSQVIPNPTSISFNSQFIGVASASQTVIIADQNGNPLGHAITAALPQGSPFTLSSGSTCAASTTQVCSLTVSFDPQTVGSYQQSLTLTDGTSGNVATVQVGGAGVIPPAVSLSTSSVSFLPHTVGTTSTPVAVTVSNTGGSALTVSSVQITGSGSASFSQTNNCGSVNAGSSCAINITFAPTATGLQSILVVITSNAPSSPDTIGASGTGQ